MISCLNNDSLDTVKKGEAVYCAGKGGGSISKERREVAPRGSLLVFSF